MKLDIKTNTIKGIFWGILNKSVTMIFPFLIQLIFVRRMGAEYAGLKGLFTSILSVLSLTELGFGSAITYLMYKPVAEDDVDSICALLNEFKKVYRNIGIIITCVGVALIPFLRFLINGDYPAGINVYVVYLLYLINTSISYWMFGYKTSILNAYQRVDIINKIGFRIQLFMYIIQLCIIEMVQNYYAYMAVMLVAGIANNIIISYRVDKLYPQIKCRGEISEDQKKELKLKVSGLMVAKISGTTRNSFDSIFISMYLGLFEVTMYNNYYYILSTLIGFSWIFCTSIVAGIGNNIILKSKDDNFNDMMTLNTIYLMFGGICTALMVCLYQPFIKLCYGKELLLPEGTMILFPIYFFLGRLGDIRGIYSEAKGLFWEERKRCFFEAIANIILNYCFIRIWGVWGIVFATIVTLFIFGFVWSAKILFDNYYEFGQKQYFISSGYWTLVAVINGAICYFACSRIWFSHGIVELLIKFLVTSSLSVVVYYFFLRRDKHYHIILMKLKYLLGNRIGFIK